MGSTGAEKRGPDRLRYLNNRLRRVGNLLAGYTQSPFGGRDRGRRAQLEVSPACPGARQLRQVPTPRP